MKNTTINIIEKRREGFEKEIPETTNSLLNEEIKQTPATKFGFKVLLDSGDIYTITDWVNIQAHTNATLHAIAQGEVARLEGEKRRIDLSLPPDNIDTLQDYGFNIAINDQIDHWKQIISFLNE